MIVCQACFLGADVFKNAVYTMIQTVEQMCRFAILACCVFVVAQAEISWSDATPPTTTTTSQTHSKPAADVDASTAETIQSPIRPPGDSAAPLDGSEGRELLLRNFRPQSKLKVHRTEIPKASFPVVDVHTHFMFKLRENRQALNDFVAVMDRNGIAVCVSLDGRLDGTFGRHRDFLWKHHHDRFVIFAHLDWRGDGVEDQPSTWACNQPGFAQRTAARIRHAVDEGASGLKIFKNFGLRYRYPDGSLIKIDDRRFDPIWKVCGELGIPVIMHTADPAAFFDPVDATNERWEELSRHPDWSFYGDEFPARSELLEARNRVIRRHPETTFIGAHVANNPEDLNEVAAWLDQMPNLVVEIASRIGELGRQPYTARRFMIRYADRIMFGTDGPQPEARLNAYWRFLETKDESFAYSEKIPPPQGMWNIHGVGLPPDVLKKIYHLNAAKFIPGVAERLPPSVP